jgi:DNA-binding MarR family transcriptional regulator
MTDHRHLAGDTWEALFRAQVVMMRGFTASKVWGTLSTTEYDVLFTLSRGPAGGMRQSQIAEMQLIGQSSLSRLIDRLEINGYVHRVPDPDDARSALIQLTDSGRSTQRAIGTAHLDDIAHALGDRLTPAELLDLQRLCKKLIGSSSLTQESTSS